MASFLQEAEPKKTRELSDELKVETEDIDTVRRELKKLRRGREMLALRVRKAKRELARTRRRQKESRAAFLESEELVASLAKDLGCPTAGLPEIDEWRELAREHSAKEKSLRQQIEDAKEAHPRNMQALQRMLGENGWPETETSQQAKDDMQRRRQAESNVMCIQAIRDFVDGSLEDLSVEELREVLREPGEPDRDLNAGKDYSNLVSAVLAELEANHQESMRELAKLTRATLGQKDAALKMLDANILGRGLEDVRLCTPPERAALKDLLADAENVVARVSPSGANGIDLSAAQGTR